VPSTSESPPAAAQHRHRRRRPQARRDRLAHAQPRRGLRLRPSLAHPRKDPPARAPSAGCALAAASKRCRAYS
jgi:hypothetical protein